MKYLGPDGLPRFKGERGFIPLLPGTFNRYRSMWGENTENLKRIVEPWRDEYNTWPDERVYNGWFNCGDAELYYAMIRTYRPNLIIEVGSGFCTGFAVQACQDNGTGRMICIDPLPRTDLPDFVRFEERTLQQVDPRFFDQLEENDILFIDTSHEAEETLYHYQILDRVAPGVIVHHHDFSFPNTPDWPEENVIISYYVNWFNQWEGLVNNALARVEMGIEGYSALFPKYMRHPHRYPGSIWTRRSVSSEMVEAERYITHLEPVVGETVGYARKLEGDVAEAVGYARTLDGNVTQIADYAHKLEGDVAEAAAYARTLDANVTQIADYARKIEGNVVETIAYARKLEGDVAEAAAYAQHVTEAYEQMRARVQALEEIVQSPGRTARTLATMPFRRKK